MMIPQDILDILELEASVSIENARDKAIKKLPYFEQLFEAAPNQVLKNIHDRNLQKLNNFINTTSNNISPVHSNQNHIQTQSHIVGWLICHTENMPIKEFELYDGLNYIGRKSQGYAQEIIINDDYVSRLHGVIEIINNEFILYDIGMLQSQFSKNGIFVNGHSKKIQAKVKLNSNDTIQIGMTKLILKINNTISIQDHIKEVENLDYVKTVVIDLF